MKSHKYTLITVFLSFVFTLGSMAGMNLILKARERQFLTESGRTVVEAPIRVWQEQRAEEDNEENTGKDRYTLSTRQIEEAIVNWGKSEKMIIHNPVTGQISMEEAIQAGNQWLTDMGMEDIGINQNADPYLTNAILCTSFPVDKELTGMPPELYYSFWEVQLSNPSFGAVLYVNAVNGMVMNAEIILYEDLPEKIPYEKLSRFVELSGLKAHGENPLKNTEGTKAILEIEDSYLWAEMDFQHSQVRYKENVSIVLRLTAGFPIIENAGT